MIVFYGFILSALALILLTTLFNVFTAPMLKTAHPLTESPRVSVLVPARNEEEHIETCLQSLLQQDYGNFEILVLDDESTDQTPNIVKKMADQHPGLSLFTGKPLEQGWTGKNWACHQLAQQASGMVIIFTDADNHYAPTAITHTIAWMQAKRLDLVSAFPQQFTRTWSEKLVVPSVYLSVYAFLPLRSTLWTKHPSLAAANGQWLSFKKSSYDKLGGHTSIKNEIVEDTSFARRAKKSGMRTLTTAGTGIVFARMYENWQQVYQGFSKNLFGLMDYKPAAFIIFNLFLLSIFVLPYFLIFHHPLAWLAVLFNMLIRLLLTLKYKQPAGNILLHPVAILVTMFIAINSLKSFYSKGLAWKGRIIF